MNVRKYWRIVGVFRSLVGYREEGYEGRGLWVEVVGGDEIG